MHNKNHNKTEKLLFLLYYSYYLKHIPIFNCYQRICVGNYPVLMIEKERNKLAALINRNATEFYKIILNLNKPGKCHISTTYCQNKTFLLQT